MRFRNEAGRMSNSQHFYVPLVPKQLAHYCISELLSGLNRTGMDKSKLTYNLVKEQFSARSYYLACSTRATAILSSKCFSFICFIKS